MSSLMEELSHNQQGEEKLNKVFSRIEGDFKKPSTLEKIKEMRANLFPFMFSASFFVLLILLISYIAQSYNWQFDKVLPHIISYTENGLVAGILLKSLVVTVQLVIVSLIIALFLGLLLAGMNLSASPVANLIAKTFIGIVRNTPLLMQLYLVYFVFAPIFSLTPFLAASLALACFEGAYMAEIFRAGFKSVPHTQWESGFSLGFNTLQVGRIIVLPQAITNIFPSLIGQAVSLIKDTSLVSAIAVAELTLRASELISETFLSFEIWIIVALFYLILTSCVSIPAYIYAKHKKKLKGKLQ